MAANKGTKRKRVVLDIPTVSLACEFGVGKSTITDIKSAKCKVKRIYFQQKEHQNG